MLACSRKPITASSRAGVVFDRAGLTKILRVCVEYLASPQWNYARLTRANGEVFQPDQPRRWLGSNDCKNVARWSNRGPPSVYAARGADRGSSKVNVFHVPSPSGKGEKVADRPDEGADVELI